MKKLLLVITLLISSNAQAMNYKKEISALKEDLGVLQKKVYQTENNKPDSFNDGTFEETLRDLVGRVDTFEHKLKKIDEKIDLINKDIDVRIKLIEGKPIVQAPAEKSPAKEKFVAPIAKDAPKEVTGDKVGSQELGSIVSNDVEVVYKQGMDAINAKKYDLAEQKFNYVLDNFKDSKLIGNAQYWLGEVFYVTKDYKKAAVAFSKGYQIKDSNKGADSLLKLGMSMLALKKDKEACTAFMNMEKTFPKAEKTILEKANAEAKKLECK